MVIYKACVRGLKIHKDRAKLAKIAIGRFIGKSFFSNHEGDFVNINPCNKKTCAVLTNAWK